MKATETKINKVNHIAIAVKDINSAKKNWEQSLGCNVGKIKELPEHGVKVLFISFQNIKIELIEPLGDNSPIEKFLDKNPKGGIHHICLEVNDINKAKEKIVKHGTNILGDGSVKTGAHGKPVIFLNPSDFSGTLIELEEG